MSYKKEIEKIRGLKGNTKVIMINNDNAYYRDEFINEINKTYFDGKFSNNNVLLSEVDIQDVENLVKIKSLTTPRKIITVVYSNNDLTKKIKIKKPKPKTISCEEKLIEIFTDSNSETLIILLPDSIDKRKSIYKFVDKNGVVFNFEVCDNKVAKKFILKYVDDNGGEITDKNAELLLSLVSNDLYLIKNELDKLLMYDDVVKSKNILELVNKSADVVIYELSELIAKKDVKGALTMINECVANGTTYFQILPLLIRYFRMINYAKIYKSNFGKELKVPPFLAKKYLSQAEGFSAKQIIEYLELLLECEKSLKTGINKDMFFEYIIMKLCGGK